MTDAGINCCIDEVRELGLRVDEVITKLDKLIEEKEEKRGTQQKREM